jgi:hypothetical protein
MFKNEQEYIEHRRKLFLFDTPSEETIAAWSKSIAEICEEENKYRKMKEKTCIKPKCTCCQIEIPDNILRSIFNNLNKSYKCHNCKTEIQLSWEQKKEVANYFTVTMSDLY